MSFRTRLLTVSLAAFAGFPLAQAAEVDLFGGYAYVGMKPQDQPDRVSMNGWNTTVSVYPKSRIGVTADFAGFYRLAPTTGFTDLDVHQYSFMAGPQVRLFQKGRLSTSARAVFGAAYGLLPDAPDPSANQTKFASLVGSNIDYRVTRRISIRFSPGLYITTFGNDQTQKNFRMSIGPVFHFSGGE